MLIFSVLFVLGTLVACIMGICIFVHNHHRTAQIRTSREALQAVFLSFSTQAQDRPALSESMQRVVIDMKDPDWYILDDLRFPKNRGRKLLKAYHLFADTEVSTRLADSLDKPNQLFYMLAPVADPLRYVACNAMIRRNFKDKQAVLLWSTVEEQHAKE